MTDVKPNPITATAPNPDSLAGFHRSQNDNGSYHTLCLDCLRTIAWFADEPELSEIEKKHLCPEKALKRILAASVQ